MSSNVNIMHTDANLLPLFKILGRLERDLDLTLSHTFFATKILPPSFISILSFLTRRTGSDSRQW
jgi:hypothetical protein